MFMFRSPILRRTKFHEVNYVGELGVSDIEGKPLTSTKFADRKCLVNFTSKRKR